MAVLPNDVGGDRDTLPASSPTPSVSQPWKKPVNVHGVAAAFGPTAEEAADLPEVDARTAKALGLPKDFNVPERDRRSLNQEQAALVASGENREPVSAVLLVNGPKGAAVPVLHRPALEHPWQTVDLALADLQDESGNAWIPLSDGLIAPDGLQVAFLQPRRVVLLDVPSAQLRDIPIDEPYLHDVGWTLDGAAMIVSTESGKAWRVDGSSMAVTALPASPHAGASKVVSDSQGVSSLQSFDEQGRLGSTRALPRVVYGGFGAAMTETTLPNPRIASGLFVNGDMSGFPTYDGTMPYQGIFIGGVSEPSRDEMLLAPESATGNQFVKGCCRALRWVDSNRLLIQWGPDILLWNPQAQDLQRASKAPEPTGGSSDYPPEGSTTSSFAVAP